MNVLLTAFFSSLLFGLGLGISGMTLPSKVLGFLDVTGNWDASLIFVMVGAILVHGVSYRLIKKRDSPVLVANFQITTRRDIDWKLILGSAIFGAGWGLGGFCPGPALVSVVTGQSSVLIFVLSMIVGIYLHQFISSRSTLNLK